MLLAVQLTFVLAFLSLSAIASPVFLQRRSPMTIYHGTCKEHVADIKKALKLLPGPFPGDFTYKPAFYCTDSYAQAHTYVQDIKGECKQGHAVVALIFSTHSVLNLGTGTDDNSPAVKKLQFFHACQQLALKVLGHEKLDAADTKTKAMVDKHDVISGAQTLKHPSCYLEY
ncbi:uncharacterized protein LACBIDRAFT_327156 [Laccaria bicolor S238N-H82]|uniref:Predicted protein n=1 Tax=Laccaria bicolor (strain S238N-H82 / ATCC MYA-4686) TaxID=486041 RepID=B0DBC1_LACBS|nr:uncharacterized protein LACBIDRAFT_327156 [Laccaria bicolor S238N-H82]EDR07965.1 predicted protein [Laccaria bicolor S238N-H82]|eukprot:XP_001881035.1 predicted protein [Laccaria bicolor S238N-H82]